MADKQRLIFHCDCNNFYASCECLERPDLKDVPMAVAGDPEQRAGIVVAKNELAKKAGVKTTDTVWQARRKCPGIVFVPPRHKYYEKISGKVNAVYHEYTDYLEPASIDESYLDLTGAPAFYGYTPVQLADELRRRVREEIGVTISVGVSYNKAFAKMGSDYKKPDATTLITKDNYREILWPLPVSDLFFAGKATVNVLHKKGIITIGDLAQRSRGYLQGLLGKGGEQLWIYANGMDESPVRLWGDKEEVKSISRGMTFPHDLITEEDVKGGVRALADRVASQLRRQNLVGACVQVQIKTPQLATVSRQTTLRHHTCLSKEIEETILQLIHMHWRIGASHPIRAITVGMASLKPSEESSEQLSFFDYTVEGRAQQRRRERQERLEAAVDDIRKKLGDSAVSRGFSGVEDGKRL